MPYSVLRTMPEPAGALTFTPREGWGAGHGRGVLLPGPVGIVVLHHSLTPDLPPSATVTQEIAAVRGIERHHVERTGWQAIAYNWLVAPSGRIYEGRGWHRVGSHAPGANERSVGVCILMDGRTKPAGIEAITGVRSVIRLGVGIGAIVRSYTVGGHRDYTPDRECPGDALYAQIPLLLPSLARPAPVPVPEDPALHPAARALLDARWRMRREVSVAALVDAMTLVRRLATDRSVAGQAAAAELATVANEVIDFYARAG